MKITHAAFFALMATLTGCLSATTQTASDQLQWIEDSERIALLRNDTVLWQLNIDPAQDKPYFHPLRTPAGHDLTLERPADHPWHRGLWFSWKTINGINYWEEDVEAGVSEGRSIIQQVESQLNDDHSARITIHITYRDTIGPTIREQRTLHIDPPLASPGYTINWEHSFTALKDVELELEKPAKHGGVQWGGYAGLSFRGAATLQDPLFRASNGWSNAADTTGYGEKATWMDMTGSVGSDSLQLAGITIFDHPANPRYPSPWYIWYAAGKHLFFTPSLLFDGPLTLQKGEELELKYQTFIHDGKPTVQQIEAISEEFGSR